MKIVYDLLTFISFLLLWGTAGASDNGNISITQSLVQSAAALIAMYIFVRLGDRYNKKQRNNNCNDNDSDKAA